MASSGLIPATSPLRRLRSLPKFAHDKLCILVVRHDSHLQAECMRALEQLGHKVVEVRLGKDGAAVAPSDNLQAVLEAVVTHRPDMLLSINYTGFDRVNWMGEAIEAVGLPTAVWFVDSPLFVAQGYLPPTPEFTTLFLWDRSYIPALKQLGAERLYHLPLATCAQTFCAASKPSATQYPQSFVGHTLCVLERRWHGRLDAQEVASGQAMAQALAGDRQALHTLVPNPGAPVDRNILVLAYANMVASKSYRLAQFTALGQKGLHLFGDPDWSELLPDARAQKSVAYGAQLAEVFRHTAININATNLQMPKTVNQRVFDVPWAGGFLLTDAQEELFDLFEPDTEVITYSSPQELADKAAWFQTRPQLRHSIIARAQARIAKEHMYVHRLDTMLGHMRRLYGPKLAKH